MEVPYVNIDDLLNARAIEQNRIEYKGTWSEPIKLSVVKTVCAFANDILNLNGGYIILGVETEIDTGKPILPPRGLNGLNLDKIQQEIRVACKQVDPEYQPLIVPVIYKESDLIIIWAPGGDNRPYTAPNERNAKERVHYIRHASDSVAAQGDMLRQLLELTAKTPFDDRRRLEATLYDFSPMLVKRYLSEVKSELLNLEPIPSDEDLYKSLRIVSPIHNGLVPKNCGLMFFTEQPNKYFEGCLFEVVQFRDDTGSLLEEKRFTGPINTQIESVLRYMEDLTNTQLQKVAGRAKVDRCVAYPYEALEEAIVNAAYHRSYENATDPNKIYLYPDRIEIISYPGPVPGLKPEHVERGGPLPPFPYRNRRIGDFLKELRLAEMRGTGIPTIRRKMEENGSPQPNIDFTDEYFRVTLPAHPKYLVIHALRESSYLWSIGERKEAVSILERAYLNNSSSGAVVGQLMEYYHSFEYQEDKAEKLFNQFHSTSMREEVLQPYLRYYKILLSAGKFEAAKKAFLKTPEENYEEDYLEVALAFKKLKIYDRAHTIYSKVYQFYSSKAEFLHDFAGVKISIANENHKSERKNWALIRRLREEAIDLLKRAIILFDGNDRQKAWCWFDLARTLQLSKASTKTVEEAYHSAMQLWSEHQFKTSYDRWKASLRSS